MLYRERVRRLVVLLVWLFTVPAAAAPDGAALYDRFCLACHGATGDGKGPAAAHGLWPAPRDFTRGRYKWRTTPSGKPPSDDDLRRSIREGAPGTSMPGYAGILDDAQIDALLPVLKGFAPERFRQPAAPVSLATPGSGAAERGKALFVELGCSSCHGESARGDGPMAATLKDDQGRASPPYDLAREPMRRARRGAEDIFVTLSVGLDGTPMPAYGSMDPADLWALATWLDGVRFKGARSLRDSVSVDARAPKSTPPVGLTPPAQGPPPPSLPPAAASLSASQCGRCHAKQHREWQGSLHAHAASPGFLGQFPGSTHAFQSSCRSCHAPLAEQADDPLRAEGISCAGCHVRGWTRHGPPRRADSALLRLPTYPLVEDAAYERSDFCLPCHQLPPSAAVAGRPLLNTYREWLDGPYMRRGVQCQHCHMPDREHSWKGVHDAETVRQGLTIDVRAAGRAVRVTLTNVGAGHFLPTTPTPALFVVVQPEDEDGDARGKPVEKRIGRHIRFTTAWQELEDTRIPPGESLSFTAPVDAPRARVTVLVHPDDFYEGFYKSFLARKNLAPQARRDLETALKRAQGSHYKLAEYVLPL